MFTNEYDNHRDDWGISWNDKWVHQGGIPRSYYRGRNGRYVKEVERPSSVSEEEYNKLKSFHKRVNKIILEEYNKLETN